MTKINAKNILVAFSLFLLSFFFIPAPKTWAQESLQWSTFSGETHLYHWGEEGQGLVAALFEQSAVKETTFRPLTGDLMDKILNYQGPLSNGALLGSGIYVAPDLASSAGYAKGEKPVLVVFKIPGGQKFLDITYYKADGSRHKNPNRGLYAEGDISDGIFKFNPGISSEKYKEYFVIKSEIPEKVEYRMFSPEEDGDLSELLLGLHAFPETYFAPLKEKMTKILSAKLKKEMESSLDPLFFQKLYPKGPWFSRDRISEVLERMIQENAKILNDDSQDSFLFSNLVFTLWKLDEESEKFGKMLHGLLDWRKIPGGSLAERMADWVLLQKSVEYDVLMEKISSLGGEVSLSSTIFQEKFLKILLQKMTDSGKVAQRKSLEKLAADYETNCLSELSLLAPLSLLR